MIENDHRRAGLVDHGGDSIAPFFHDSGLSCARQALSQEPEQGDHQLPGMRLFV